MSYQRQKLTKFQITRLDCAIGLLRSFQWQCSEEGDDFWSDVIYKLSHKVEHGTSDGKPWVEPERWRVPTDEDARMRPECRVRDHEDQEWQQATLYIVDDSPSENYRYYARLKDVTAFDWWYYCEIIDNETKTE